MTVHKKTALFVLKGIIAGIIFLPSLLELSGCSALSTAVEHHKMKIQSKMSNSVFLDPVSDKDKTIYVQIRNTTSEKLPELKTKLETDLKDGGWKVIHDVAKAHDMVQINVLQAGQAKDPKSVWVVLTDGYGSAIVAGTLAGLAVDHARHNLGVDLVLGGVVGLGAWFVDEMVKDVTYSVITDVQISVRMHGKVREKIKSNLKQGSSTHVFQVYDHQSHWLRYRTRVASLADKMNLKFKAAKPRLAKQIATEVSGIFTG